MGCGRWYRYSRAAGEIPRLDLVISGKWTDLWSGGLELSYPCGKASASVPCSETFFVAIAFGDCVSGWILGRIHVSLG